MTEDEAEERLVTSRLTEYQQKILDRVKTNAFAKGFWVGVAFCLFVAMAMLFLEKYGG